MMLNRKAKGTADGIIIYRNTLTIYMMHFTNMHSEYRVAKRSDDQNPMLIGESAERVETGPVPYAFGYVLGAVARR